MKRKKKTVLYNHKNWFSKYGGKKGLCSANHLSFPRKLDQFQKIQFVSYVMFCKFDEYFFNIS